MSNLMFVMNTTPPLNSKLLGIPSAIKVLDSVFQHNVLFLPVSSAAFNRFKAKSSYRMASQSSKQTT